MKTKEQIPVKTQKGTAAIPERLTALDAEEYFAVLATDDGHRPYTSLVAYALTPDRKKIIFATPKKTRKYTNIISSANVALLIDNRPKRKKSLMETEAITVIGMAKPVRKGRMRAEFARIFLRKHPDLGEFVNSSTTALMAIDIVQCVHVSRFQTVSVFDYI
jgi:heme iron utilization protein